MGKLLLGIVADDFTGASDAASFAAAAGLSTVLVNGVPKAELQLPTGTEVVVAALKSRTAPVEEAVSESLRAFKRLKEMGAEQLYFKYCSTFDSTDQGNIGPVIDAVMEHYGYDRTVLCPSLPVNGRTVRDGILYVNGVPLSESSMRNHPLTPMRKSRIRDLMAVQGKYPCIELSANADVPANTGTCYLVPDYYEETQGDRIAAQFGDLPFLTGGSGLVGALARRLAEYREAGGNVFGAADGQKPVFGKALLLAGSCSQATLGQIRQYQKSGGSSMQIHPAALLSGEENADTFWSWISEQKEIPLVYSSAEPEDLRKSQELGRELVAAAIEMLLAELAVRAAKEGYSRIIVAGGETSGAVTKALGYDAFRIGESVAPGVPVMTPLAAPEMRLVLKSGNFGQDDFFARAIRMTEK